LCLGRGYVPAFSGAQKTFRATETGVRIEIITSGEYPGDGLPKPVSFPDPQTSSVDRGGIHVVTLERLVELKLASGMTAPHRRRDLADVQDLIRTLGLQVDFAEQLDASVRTLYRQLWEEAHSPDPLQESQWNINIWGESDESDVERTGGRNPADNWKVAEEARLELPANGRNEERMAGGRRTFSR
jgi:hypothetical protein